MDESTQEIEQIEPKADLPVTIEEGLEQSVIEALLFSSDVPVAPERMAEITGITKEAVEAAIIGLKSQYAENSSGIEIIQVADKYQLRTRNAFAPYIRALRADRPRRLSNAALETLAVIAYRQPVVKSDIEKIRGVDVTPTLKTLLDRGLARIVGHQSTVGQPALYGTTEEFLTLFGLKSLGELPTLRDIKEFERDPGEQQNGEAGDETGSARSGMDDGNGGGEAAISAG